MGQFRKVYPSDVTDEEWWFVLPYLLLCRDDAGQREYELRDVFDAVRYVARSGCAWRMIPGDLPPWAAVYQRFRRWLDAGVFEALVADVQSIVREWAGRKDQPSAICIDSRTLQSTPESGARAGYDGAKRRKGSKVHIAVDTLGRLLALTVTPADQGDRDQVAPLAEQVQKVTGHTVELAYVDQGYLPALRGKVIEGDVRKASSMLRSYKERVKLVITSPPYIFRSAKVHAVPVNEHIASGVLPRDVPNNIGVSVPTHIGGLRHPRWSNVRFAPFLKGPPS